MAALALASPPLLQYNTRSGMNPGPGVTRAYGGKVLEWVYGCPPMMIIFVAKVNACRVDKWMGQVGPSYDDWRELERELKEWGPSVDYVGDSTGRVMRLAIQEGWRHALLIYLYMGMYGADSADPRVELAVPQVVRLATMVFPGNLLENYLFMPCLIAGVAARCESHRVILRQKLSISKNENIWCLRGADFVPVLDYLWHGAGAGGYPTTWENYAAARRVVLSIEG